MGDGTAARHLSNIERFYQSVEQATGADCLDEIITRQDFDRIEICLGSFLATLQNDASRRGVDLSDTWRSVLGFTTQVMAHFGDSASEESGQIHARLMRLRALYGQLVPNRKNDAPPIRALPALVLEELYEIFDPNSDRNPFEGAENRYRNELMFLLYAELGLRKGEVLILPTSTLWHEKDYQSGKIYQWINVFTLNDPDPRYVPASLKTKPSQRQISVSNEIATKIRSYRTNYRPSCKFSQLFISQKKSPYSSQSIGDIFRIATKQLSDEAKILLVKRGWASLDPESDSSQRRWKKWISPHDLRHTSVVCRLMLYLDEGFSIDDAMEKLKVFYGWSSSSKMPKHYARAYWATQGALDQEEDFEAYITALRRIDFGFQSRGGF